MPKQLKSKVLSEEQKGPILTLHTEGNNEHQVAFILKVYINYYFFYFSQLKTLVFRCLKNI